MNVRVRPATTEDAPALAALLQTADQGSGLMPVKSLPDDDPEQRICSVLACGRTVLVAAEETGVVLGALVARHDDAGAFDLTPVLHVTHLVVTPGQRRRGLARSLLAAAVQLADDEGIENVVATAPAGSREGNRYLARLGFAPVVTHRIAPTASLRRALGMTDDASRVAVLRRARLLRAQRSGFGTRAARGA